MAECLESSGFRVKANDLLSFQKELKEEKELLEKILQKIDDQLNALKVEQLHLLHLVNKPLTDKKANMNTSNSTNNDGNSTKTLDLTVAKALKYFEELEEDEDEDF